MKKIFFSAVLFVAFGTVFSFDAFSQDESYSYAYVSVKGKVFSKKLKVQVDLGDSPQQIKEGEKYSNVLHNKKSYASIINYMVEDQFELVETLEFIELSNGTGGTTGIVFLMRKKKL